MYHVPGVFMRGAQYTHYGTQATPDNLPLTLLAAQSYRLECAVCYPAPQWPGNYHRYSYTAGSAAYIRPTFYVVQ